MINCYMRQVQERCQKLAISFGQGNLIHCRLFHLITCKKHIKKHDVAIEISYMFTLIWKHNVTGNTCIQYYHKLEV